MIVYDYDSHNDVGDVPWSATPTRSSFSVTLGTLSNARGRSHGGIRRVQVQPERFLSALGSTDGRRMSFLSFLFQGFGRLKTMGDFCTAVFFSSQSRSWQGYRTSLIRSRRDAWNHQMIICPMSKQHPQFPQDLRSPNPQPPQDCRASQLLMCFPTNSPKKPAWPTTARTAWLMDQSLQWMREQVVTFNWGLNIYCTFCWVVNLNAVILTLHITKNINMLLLIHSDIAPNDQVWQTCCITNDLVHHPQKKHEY